MFMGDPLRGSRAVRACMLCGLVLGALPRLQITSTSHRSGDYSRAQLP